MNHTTTDENRRTGEAHHRSRYPDSTVERARDMADAGMTVGAIARELGVPYHTARDWCRYRTRIGPGCYRTLRRRAA